MITNPPLPAMPAPALPAALWNNPFAQNKKAPQRCGAFFYDL
jgi:hypothetical protein